MNRNTIIGVLLIGAIFIIWSLVMTPSKEERLKEQRKQDSIARVQQRKIDSINRLKAESEALKKEIRKDEETDEKEQIAKKEEVTDTTKFKDQYGTFSNAAINEEKLYFLENELFKLKILNRGGRIYSVELKKYVTYDSLPLILFDSDSSVFGLNFFSDNRLINTNDLFFQPYWPDETLKNKDSIYVSGEDSVRFAMRLYPNREGQNANDDSYIEYLYTIYGDQYMMDFKINLVGVQDLITTRFNTLDLKWKTDIRQQEKSVDRWNVPTVFYKFYEDDVDNLSGRDDDKESLKTRVKWISYKQHFFCSTLISDGYFDNADVEAFTDPNPDNPRYLKSMYSVIGIPFQNSQRQMIDLAFYFGPLKYNTLRKYRLELERQIPLGWGFFLLSWINIYAVIPVFNFLGSFGWNYGIIILILTVLLKIVLLPVAYKTYKSSAKMRVLRPEIEEINKKYPKKEDAMKKQQATMKLYKQAGANPLSGCLPMLLQLPILIAMFRFFPSSIELRQKSFLWADDLSSYDSIWTFPDGFSIPFYGDHVSLFTLLMTVSTIIYTRMNSQMMSTGQQMPGMKVMMYIMPVMFLGIFNNYASALSYYYLLANLITFAQMYIFRAAIDEKKLRRKIEIAKKKPVKKSGFQKRLEDAAKRRQRGYSPPKKKRK